MNISASIVLLSDVMVAIPGGTFRMGCSDCGMDDARPVHVVEISPFLMDATPVTNAAFQRFVRATAYRTVAERPLDPALFPGVAAVDLVPGSAVFVAPSGDVPLVDHRQWWRFVPGASWWFPDGPGRNTAAIRLDHPVVHVAWEDAVSYCRWQDKRLPTEAEFERAARGGLDGKRYAWGDELRPNGRLVANLWDGQFPTHSTKVEGPGTTPVMAYPPNSYGLYDVAGNVWQWTSDWYRADYYQTVATSGLPMKDPVGPATSDDPAEPGVKKRVQKGGSFLCSERYCSRFLVGSRGRGEVESSSGNVGFRCARDNLRSSD